MPGTRVYIGGLPQGCRERDIERFCKGYGKLRDILIKNGFGFIEFEDPRDADDAVYELNGKDLLGERVTMESARGPSRRYDDFRGGGRFGGRDQRFDPRRSRFGPPTRTEHRLIIENLSSRVSWQDLKDYMRQAGEVTYADAHKDTRGEGIVEFACGADLRRAMDKLDDTDLNGRRIRLVDQSLSRRRHSRSRSRSRSRHSRSRSRSRGSRSRSRSRSRGRDRSRSKSRSRSKDRRSGSKDRRSGSKDRRAGSKDRRSKSKSQDREKSRERQASGGQARSRSRDRSQSKEKEYRKSRSKSRSRSASRSRSRSAPRDNGGDAGEN